MALIVATSSTSNNFDRPRRTDLLASAFGLLRMLGVLGSRDGRRGLAITGDCVHSFFDVYLKGAPATQLKDLSSRYPEVQIEPH